MFRKRQLSRGVLQIDMHGGRNALRLVRQRSRGTQLTAASARFSLARAARRLSVIVLATMATRLTSVAPNHVTTSGEITASDGLPPPAMFRDSSVTDPSA
jgi:hypothetical protein